MNQLKTGAVLSYVLLCLNAVVGLLYIPFMLRTMGKSEFGLYSLVSSIIAYLTMFDLGFGNAIIRYTAKFRSEKKYEEQYSMFGMFFLLYSVIGVFVVLLGATLYFNVHSFFQETLTQYELERAKILISIMVFNLAITFPFSVFGSIVSGYEDFIFQKVVQIVRLILNTIVAIIVLKMGYRAVGIVVVITILNLLSLATNWWYCIFRIKIKVRFKKFDYTLLREISLYSFYIFLNIIMDRVYWSTGQFILATISGTAAVTIFALSIQLQQMYMNFSTAISGVLLPKITSMVTQKRPTEEISDLFIRTGRLQFLVMAFILTGFIVFGKKFVHFWAGPSNQEVYYISLILFVPLTIPLIQNAGIVILQARNQMKFRSLLYLVLAILSISIQIPLAKMLGAIGCAVGICVSLVLGQFVGMNIYYYKKQGINIPLFWKEIAKLSVFPVIMIFTGICVVNYSKMNSIFSLFAGVLIFCVVYLPMIWLTSMNSYEKSLIRSPIYSFIRKLKSSNV